MLHYRVQLNLKCRRNPLNGDGTVALRFEHQSLPLLCLSMLQIHPSGYWQN